jgi:hypothetical protein
LKIASGVATTLIVVMTLIEICYIEMEINVEIKELWKFIYMHQFETDYKLFFDTFLQRRGEERSKRTTCNPDFKRRFF